MGFDLAMVAFLLAWGWTCFWLGYQRSEHHRNEYDRKMSEARWKLIEQNLDHSQDWICEHPAAKQYQEYIARGLQWNPKDFE